MWRACWNSFSCTRTHQAVEFIILVLRQTQGQCVVDEGRSRVTTTRKPGSPRPLSVVVNEDYREAQKETHNVVRWTDNDDSILKDRKKEHIPVDKRHRKHSKFHPDAEQNVAAKRSQAKSGRGELLSLPLLLRRVRTRRILAFAALGILLCSFVPFSVRRYRDSGGEGNEHACASASRTASAAD